MDILLVGFIGGFTFGGWRSGFILRLFGLLFMAISLVLGAYLRVPFGAIATAFFPNIPEDYATLVGYTIAFPVILTVLHVATHPFIKRFHPRGRGRMGKILKPFSNLTIVVRQVASEAA